jgi:hypothetical protein
MAKVVVALSWSTGSKKGRCRSEINKKTTTTGSGYEASSGRMSNTAGMFHESVHYEERQLGVAVQKCPNNYWCTNTWYQKLYKNSPRIIGVRTPGAKSCENILQELLIYGRLLLKNAKMLQELLSYGHLVPKIMRN